MYATQNSFKCEIRLVSDFLIRERVSLQLFTSLSVPPSKTHTRKQCMRRKTLTASKLEGTCVPIHGKVHKLHGTLCTDGQPVEEEKDA